MRAGTAIAGVLAALAVWLSGLGVSLACVVLVFAGVVVLRAWRSSGAYAGHRLALMPDGAWMLRAPDGGERQLELRAATDLSFLVVLTLGDRRGRLRIPVAADTIDADTLRRLRVWLRGACLNRPRPAGAEGVATPGDGKRAEHSIR